MYFHRRVRRGSLETAGTAYSTLQFSICVLDLLRLLADYFHADDHEPVRVAGHHEPGRDYRKADEDDDRHIPAAGRHQEDAVAVLLPVEHPGSGPAATRPATGIVNYAVRWLADQEQRPIPADIRS